MDYWRNAFQLYACKRIMHRVVRELIVSARLRAIGWLEEVGWSQGCFECISLRGNTENRAKKAEDEAAKRRQTGKPYTVTPCLRLIGFVPTQVLQDYIKHVGHRRNMQSYHTRMEWGLCSLVYWLS